MRHVAPHPPEAATAHSSGPAARVFVVHRTRVFRDALAAALAASGQVEVVGAGALGPALPEEIARSEPDVVLMPPFLVAEAGIVRDVVAAHEGARVIVIGVAATEGAAVAHAEAGVAGFIPDDASLHELAEAAHDHFVRRNPVPAELGQSLLQELAARAESPRVEEPLVLLTRRELEIADLISQGLPNKVIASRLSIQVRTVKNHVHSILRRLRVNSRRDVMLPFSRRHGDDVPRTVGATYQEF